jgi:type III restriction enzyme
MSERLVDSIHGRMSLRAPLRDSLDVLRRMIAGGIPLRKDQDLVAALAAARAVSPTVTDFERDFPSLCFAIATGVGKTRLMGAFITYLHLARGTRHFFVLAPNLTIYDKLIREFTPGDPKYVFNGIAEFAQTPPEIITGDNYESGRGVREDRQVQYQLGVGGVGAGDGPIHVNIFNISKINTEVRGGATPRIKRLAEYIGESYFDYLAALPDLVLLMDESHRYRASAGVRAINELKPVLGLELTATPYVEAGNQRQVFKNVAYEYSLASAIRDGFVKEPAVATRENFRPGDYSAEQLDDVKLRDGVRLHEATKVELETYGRQFEKPLVKPFMLVIARDVEHAATLERVIKADDFFEGRYKDRVITVHSKQGSEEKEEVVQRLLQVERTGETEIVIHVNMLKEGWDVTNLYTIVPLRAANARTLVEQSIGRGLRLPYGRRTGVKAVDRLTIVAHDRFQEIVDEARRGDSVIQMDVVVIGKDVPDAPQQSVAIPTVVETLLTVRTPAGVGAGGNGRPAAAALFATEAERQVARVTIDEIRKTQGLTYPNALTDPEVRADLEKRVRERLAMDQLPLGDAIYGADIQRVVDTTAETVRDRTIHVPRVVVVPTEAVSAGFKDFDLDARNLHLQPVDDALIVQLLQSGERARLAAAVTAVEERPEDYIVRHLIDFQDVSYDDQSDLLYKLAGQAVAHLQTYLNEDQLDNVLLAHGPRIAEFIHAQMDRHYWQSDVDYVAEVRQGSLTLEPITVTSTAGEPAHDYRELVRDANTIRRMRFTGYAKCVYTEQRFDSVPEKRFAEIVDGDAAVEKWVKPGPKTVRIDYATGVAYEPDFIVQTTTTKWLCEPKAANEIDDEDVRAKARAAEKWCEYASEHELKHGGKPWRYLLIPDSAITANATLAGLIATYGY